MRPRKPRVINPSVKPRGSTVVPWFRAGPRSRRCSNQSPTRTREQSTSMIMGFVLTFLFKRMMNGTIKLVMKMLHASGFHGRTTVRCMT